jgi:hypothetical protein
VVVLPGETSEVVCDWSEGGGIELNVSCLDGSPYCGILRVRLSEPMAMVPNAKTGELEAIFKGVSFAVFNGPPYRLLNLDPEAYAICLQENDYTEHSTFKITAGSLQTLELVLSKK